MILSIPIYISIYLSFTLFYSREKSAFSFVHNDGDAESLHYTQKHFSSNQMLNLSQFVEVTPLRWR